jgi:hypothetical protein
MASFYGQAWRQMVAKRMQAQRAKSKNDHAINTEAAIA